MDYAQKGDIFTVGDLKERLEEDKDLDVKIPHIATIYDICNTLEDKNYLFNKGPDRQNNKLFVKGHKLEDQSRF